MLYGLPAGRHGAADTNGPAHSHRGRAVRLLALVAGAATESGLYWCISGPLKSGGGLYWWNAEAEQWEHWGMSFRMTPDVVLWMRCPELPESMAWERQEVPDGED